MDKEENEERDNRKSKTGTWLKEELYELETYAKEKNWRNKVKGSEEEEKDRRTKGSGRELGKKGKSTETVEQEKKEKA